MTTRLQKGGNSQDMQLMYTGDANLAPTIEDGDTPVFDETTEKFVPSHEKILKVSGLNIASIPTSSDGLSSGDVWSDSGVLTIVS